MKKPSRSMLIRYCIGTLLALMFSWLIIVGRVAGLKGIFALEASMRWHLLCDAFFLPGFLYLLTGALLALGNAGAMDAIGYLFHILVCQFHPAKTGKVESYFDYVQERRAKAGIPTGFLFVIGLEMVALAGIFLILYFNA